MTAPLSVVLLLAAAAVSAQAPAAKPQKPAAERAFEVKLAEAVKEAGVAFLVLRPPPPIPSPSQDASVTERCASRVQDYAILTARVAYVQAGRPEGDDLATFHRFIRKVAGDLKVNRDQAVLLYGSLVRSKDLAGGDPVVENAVRAGLIAELLRDQKLTQAQKKRLVAKLDLARKALETGLVSDSGLPDVNAVVEQWQTRRPLSREELGKLPPRVQPQAFKVATPPAVRPMDPKEGGILSYLDMDRAASLASEVWEGAKGFMGKCYRYVKSALDSILPEGWRSDVGQGSAYQFAKSLNANPKLFDKLKLRRVPVEELPGGLPPIGSIVVYGRSQCGFSPAHGHIEIVVSQNPPKACSDGCTDMDKGRLTCIRKKGPTGAVNVYIPVRSVAPDGD
ncbi:MAG: hypothetical protein HY924_12690 [Elusimicrobia bacterium]|nr:hypothetical protein [Elusimicrobiota bacterium]